MGAGPGGREPSRTYLPGKEPKGSGGAGAPRDERRSPKRENEKPMEVVLKDADDVDDEMLAIMLTQAMPSTPHPVEQQVLPTPEKLSLAQPASEQLMVEQQVLPTPQKLSLAHPASEQLMALKTKSDTLPSEITAIRPSKFIHIRKEGIGMTDSMLAIIIKHDEVLALEGDHLAELRERKRILSALNRSAFIAKSRLSYFATAHVSFLRLVIHFEFRARKW